MKLLDALRSKRELADRVTHLEDGLLTLEANLKALDDDIDHIDDKVKRFTGRNAKRFARDKDVEDGVVVDLNERIKQGLSVEA